MSMHTLGTGHCPHCYSTNIIGTAYGALRCQNCNRDLATEELVYVDIKRPPDENPNKPDTDTIQAGND